jgi:Sigma-70 region 2
MIHPNFLAALARGGSDRRLSGTVRGRQQMDDHRDAQVTGRVTAHPARDGTLVTDLVTRASTGDQQAWDALVERYAPLIWSICGRYRLGRADAEDVGQSVWLRLAGQLEMIRDPAALPGWLATTTSRECGRVLRTARGPHVPVHALGAGKHSGPAGRRGRPGIARGRASRGSTRRTQPLAAGRPAADRLAHR